MFKDVLNCVISLPPGENVNVKIEIQNNKHLGKVV